MVAAKKRPQDGTPKIPLVYNPSIKMKPSDRSLFFQRLQELDKDFSIQNKRLKQVVKNLQKKLKPKQ